MTWAMIKDKRKMSTILDGINEELIARNEAEDALNEKNIDLEIVTTQESAEPIKENLEDENLLEDTQRE